MTATKARVKNVMGKQRKFDGTPYITFGSLDGTWEWKLLKSWQADNGKKFARWFMGVTSPFTFGSADYGDTYVYDVLVTANAQVVDFDREVFASIDEVNELVETARRKQRENGDPMAGF